VKSQETIAFDGSRWYPETITRSPFKQASDGRYTFYRRLGELAPHFRHIPVVHCCIFPRSPFDLHKNLSVQPWELMDARLFRSFSSGMSFCSELEGRISASIAADANIRPLQRPLDLHQVDDIIRLCLPVHRRLSTPREEIDRRQLQMDRLLRDQQKPVLQLASLNRRLVVSGGAGTGKTFVAMELARRAAERGLRVALLCFNQLVGEWMQTKIETEFGKVPGLVVGRAMQTMIEMTGIEIPPSPGRDFWEVTLPALLEEKITDPDFRESAVFDYMVVDEAQDLLARPRLWECLLQFLSGGVSKGAFVILGDFDNQVLAEKEVMSAQLERVIETAAPAKWNMSENCRNYRIVGDTSIILSGLGPSVYSGYMRIGGSIDNYNIHFYEHDRNQLDTLALWIKDFKARGYKPSEITILSFRSDEASAATRLRNEGHRMRPARSSGDAVSYASVHSFKGMENKAIIITDVTLEDRKFDRNLFYTGMTRATEAVRVLCDKSSQKTLLTWLTERTLNHD
jgi:hypothetical protein